MLEKVSIKAQGIVYYNDVRSGIFHGTHGKMRIGFVDKDNHFESNVCGQGKLWMCDADVIEQNI